MHNTFPSSFPEAEDAMRKLLGTAGQYLGALLRLESSKALEVPITIQQIPEWKPDGSPGWACVYHHPFIDIVDQLNNLNQLGNGMFLAVNETDGQGRQKRNIVGLRASFVDLDGVTTLSESQLAGMPLRPSMIVFSGHGLHPYWIYPERIPCAGNLQLKADYEDELRGLQKTFIQYGADPRVCDVSRVLRIPGFLNMKREPYQQVEIVELNDLRYTPDEIRGAFELAPHSTSRDRDSTAMAQASPAMEDPSVVARAIEYTKILAMHVPAISGCDGHSTTLKAAIKVACGFNLSEETTFGILADYYNDYCLPPWSEDDLRRKVCEALTVCSDRGWLIHPTSKNDGRPR